MKVFISYSFEDKAKFDDVSFALENAGVTVWKTAEIVAGRALGNELRDAIESCAVCVFIATPKSLTSAWCQAEAGAFWGAGKPVVVYMGDNKLASDALPKQFQPDKRAETIREIVEAVKLHLRDSGEATLIKKSPANVFWLGHDLARAIRFAKFEPNKPEELDQQLRQALHHLQEIGLPADEARRLLLAMLKRHKSRLPLSAEEREQFVTTLAKSKNELGSTIARLQPGFKGYPTIEAQNRLDRELDELEQSNE